MSERPRPAVWESKNPDVDAIKKILESRERRRNWAKMLKAVEDQARLSRVLEAVSKRPERVSESDLEALSRILSDYERHVQSGGGLAPENRIEDDVFRKWMSRDGVKDQIDRGRYLLDIMYEEMMSLIAKLEQRLGVDREQNTSKAA